MVQVKEKREGAELNLLSRAVFLLLLCQVDATENRIPARRWPEPMALPVCGNDIEPCITFWVRRGLRQSACTLLTR